MSAFMDSGHHWWQECQSCGMAWFVETKPKYGCDSEDTCRRCAARPSEMSAAASRARAEALEEAWRAVSGTRMGDATASETRSMDVAAIRALVATPAPATIPAEAVRGVLGNALSLDDDGRPDFDEGWACAVMHVASKLDALGMPGGAAIAPSKDTIPVERVREVLGRVVTNGRGLLAPAHVARDVAVALRVDLDAKREAKDTRQTCTCTGACKGADGLGAGWQCALERKQ